MAGVLAWLLLALAAALSAGGRSRAAPGRLALGGLAALTALTGLSLLWAPIAGPAVDDFQRLLLYLPAFAAGIAAPAPERRRLAASRCCWPAIVAAALYGLSERLLPGVFSLERGRERRRPARLAADVLERDGRARGDRPRARRRPGRDPARPRACAPPPRRPPRCSASPST